MYRSRTCAAFLLTTVLFSVACGDDAVSVAPDPIPSIDRSFEGTLTPFSARTHFFQAQNAGEVVAQITAIDPDTTVVGLSIGTGSGATCQASVSNEQARLGGSLIGIARSAGTLCVRIYDPSDTGLPAAITYTIRVRHF